jgi:hypothetical protein
MHIYIYIIFWQYWGLDSEPCASQGGTLPLELHSKPSVDILKIKEKRIENITVHGTAL